MLTGAYGHRPVFEGAYMDIDWCLKVFTGVCRRLPVLIGVCRCLQVLTGAYRCLQVFAGVYRCL